MFLPVPSQPDCVTAWREAIRAVDAERGHEAHNVVLDITDPLAGTTRSDPRIAVVDDFLRARAKPVATVANTIFPQALYHSFGSSRFFDVFHDQVLCKAGSGKVRWSGYYFERMTKVPVAGGEPLNQLQDVVGRLKNPRVRAKNKYEVAVFDPSRDVDNSPYGGQCLSHLSFKVVPGNARQVLSLTVIYRNHYYIEKLLGNLIGLGHLMEFVAHESGLDVGHLTVVSTHAEVDQPDNCKRSDIRGLLGSFDHTAAGSMTG